MRNRQSSGMPARRRSSVVESLEGRRLLAGGTATSIGYLPDYEIGGGALTANLAKVKFAGLTHVDYFSILPTAAGVLPTTTVNGVTNASFKTSTDFTLIGPDAQIAKLVTAAHAAGVKVIVILGGGGAQSDTLGAIVKSGSTAWQTLATSAKQFAAKYSVDGFDVDWEPSTLASTDTANYGNMLATLRATNPNLYLSAAVNSERLQVNSGGSAYVLNATGMKALTNVNVMAYDLMAGNTSPIARAKQNMDAWGTYAVANGVSKQNLIFGMPFYGTSGTTWANTTALKYADLVARNGGPMSPSADSVVLGGVTWNYNGPATINNKVAYALDSGYGGSLTWEVGQDYVVNGNYDATYSLLPQFAKATLAHTGAIAGIVASAGGSAVAGVTVYLDLNANGALDSNDLSTVTNASGAYGFSNLLIGTYAVGEVVPAGYSQTSPSGATTSATSTAAGTATVNFIVAPPLIATALALVNTGSSTSDATRSLSFAATLTGGVPDGATIALRDASNNNAVVATATLTNGTATFTLAAGTLLAGTHNLVAAYAGDASYAASQSSAVAQTVQVVVTGVVVNGDNAALAGAQRSMVDSLVYTFSEPVNVAATGAFTIAVHAGQSGTLPTLTWTALIPASDGSSTQWAVTFAGDSVIGRSIANGVYDVTMVAGAITADGNPAVASQARTTDTFWRLYGDFVGNGYVNNVNYNAFLSTYGLKSNQPGYLAAFDATGANAKISNADYNFFRAVYGTKYKNVTLISTI